MDLPDPGTQAPVRSGFPSVPPASTRSEWKKRQGVMGTTRIYLRPSATRLRESLMRSVKVSRRLLSVTASSGSAQTVLRRQNSPGPSAWAPIPSTLSFAGAAALLSAVETAARALDQLGVAGGGTILINGASGTVGGAAVQLAVASLGARVIGTGSPATHDHLRKLGAKPVAYGEGMSERVCVLAPGGVNWALDVAGSSVLPELIELAGGADRVNHHRRLCRSPTTWRAVQPRRLRTRYLRTRPSRRAGRFREKSSTPCRTNLPTG